jgi:DNA transformation protein and related proteins
MGSARNEFVDHCLELLGPLGAARSRRMFGGHGIYVDDLFIALVGAERLYLKVDAQTRPQFEAAGCTPFRYSADGKSIALGYFSAPDEAIESPPLMQPWARLALAAALRARAAKPPAAKRATKARPRSGSASTAPKKV